MPNPRVVAIAQARMNSSRLPGKALCVVAGQPLLAHHLRRLQRAQRVDQVVLATTGNPEDDPLATVAAELGVAVFRGDAQDVLGRFAAAAAAHRAAVVARTTADCPLLDPELVDQVIDSFLAADPPVAYAHLDVRVFPRGLDVEVFSVTALQEAARQAREPHEREHVTPYLYQRPEIFRCQGVGHGGAPVAGRWCVDEPADLALMRHLLPRVPLDCGWREVCRILDSHPEWRTLNHGVAQKTF